MKTIEYWVVNTEYDRSSTVVGHFSNEAAALECKGSDMYRSVYGPLILKVFDTIDEFKDNTRERIRERALSKLTTEEKIALGL